MKIEELLIAKGFMVESRDDYESADGGLPEWDRKVQNSNGEYIGDFLKSNGFTEKIETDSKGRNWTVFKKDNTKVTHRAFGEISKYTGKEMEVKTFVLHYSY